MDITENELLEELLAEYNYATRRPDDVDAAQLAASDPHHRTKRFWANVLSQKVVAGELAAVEVLNENGRPIKCYRKAAP